MLKNYQYSRTVDVAKFVAPQRKNSNFFFSFGHILYAIYQNAGKLLSTTLDRSKLSTGAKQEFLSPGCWKRSIGRDLFASMIFANLLHTCLPPWLKKQRCSRVPCRALLPVCLYATLDTGQWIWATPSLVLLAILLVFTYCNHHRSLISRVMLEKTTLHRRSMKELITLPMDVGS